MYLKCISIKAQFTILCNVINIYKKNVRYYIYLVQELV